MHKKLVKFGCAVFELREQIDRQTDRQMYEHTDYNNFATLTGRS